MTSQVNLEKEYRENEIEDQDKRKVSIKDGEELDKNIKNRMNAGEIGVSHGIDNHIGIIMFVTSTLVTLLALYFIFGVVPDRYYS